MALQESNTGDPREEPAMRTDSVGFLSADQAGRETTAREMFLTDFSARLQTRLDPLLKERNYTPEEMDAFLRSKEFEDITDRIAADVREAHGPSFAFKIPNGNEYLRMAVKDYYESTGLNGGAGFNMGAAAEKSARFNKNTLLSYMNARNMADALTRMSVAINPKGVAFHDAEMAGAYVPKEDNTSRAGMETELDTAPKEKHRLGKDAAAASAKTKADSSVASGKPAFNPGSDPTASDIGASAPAKASFAKVATGDEHGEQDGTQDGPAAHPLGPLRIEINGSAGPS